MATAKYKDLNIKDFKGYEKIPTAKRSWASKLIEDFLAQDKNPVIGIELESEEEAKNRQLTLNKALRDDPALTGRVKVAKRGTSLYLERL